MSNSLSDTAERPILPFVPSPSSLSTLSSTTSDTTFDSRTATPGYGSPITPPDLERQSIAPPQSPQYGASSQRVRLRHNATASPILGRAVSDTAPDAGEFSRQVRSSSAPVFHSGFQNGLENRTPGPRIRISGRFNPEDSVVESKSENENQGALPRFASVILLLSAISLPQIDLVPDGPDSSELQIQHIEFSPQHAKVQKPRFINKKIYQLFMKKQTPSSRPGWVYILVSNWAQSHIKIGKTSNLPEIRGKQWEQTCGIPLTEIEDPFRNAFKYSFLVESLVHIEFLNERRSWNCLLCDKKHQEWFERDKDEALQSITRWRNWLIYRKPFDLHGNLTPFWAWKVEKLPEMLNDVDWDSWTQPGLVDYYYGFKLEQFDKHYGLRLKTHFSRKDFWFWSVSFVFVHLVWISRGAVDGALAFVFLLAL